MIYFALFISGALLCNSIPHLTAGLQGKPFPTPFAKPRGVGDSEPAVNFLWGAFNFALGCFLLCQNFPNASFALGFVVTLLGALVIGFHLSLHFGKVQKDKRQNMSDI